MKIKRIVSNIATSNVDKASAFYQEILGLKVLIRKVDQYPAA